MRNAGETPRQRIEAACARDGRAAVVRGCVLLLGDGPVDVKMVRVLAGPSAAWGLQSGPDQAYWFRVWGTRGLLWAWDDEALPALLVACTDEAWRVREMAAKVVARHLLGDALAQVVAMTSDPVPRVRAAAERAVGRVTAARA